jgi:hypothetical protein
MYYNRKTVGGEYRVIADHPLSHPRQPIAGERMQVDRVCVLAVT